MKKKNIILIGLGPHAKRIYYRFLSKYQKSYGINLRLLIELENQRINVDKFFKNKIFSPQEIFYIKDTPDTRLGKKIPQELIKKLNRLTLEEDIHGVIISTEPKAHMIYANWALDHNLNILMDKPISAPLNALTNQTAAKQIYLNFCELNNKLSHSKSKFYIVCQRRNHCGYKIVRDYLKQVVTEYNVPLSYVDIYHSDGTWNFPNEFEKENHPYKYGYGKLLHSGYHSVDLFAWLVQLNNELARITIDSAKINTFKFTPNDFFLQNNNQFYSKIFGQKQIDEFFNRYDEKNYTKYGELDAFTLGQLYQDNKVITTFSIDLQQNSFSRRGWYDLPEDTYKGNGRLRHERINIQVGYLLNVQVHSYQSYQAGKKDNECVGVGHEDHFDIYFFRNSELIGGKSFEQIRLGESMRKENYTDEYYLGHNEKGREQILLNFLNEREDESMLQRHDMTNYFLSNIYQSLSKGFKDGDSSHYFRLKNL